MKELINIENLNQAKVLMNPVRIKLLELLTSPKTCAEVSNILNQPQQRINHHLKELLKVKLIRIAKNRKVRNLIEATYESVGRSYWLSPKILQTNGDGRESRDHLSLSNLLVMTETIQEEVGQLLGSVSTGEVPSIGLTAEISLASDEERNEFSRDMLKALKEVIQKYESREGKGSSFTLNLMCYPKKSN